MPVDNTLNLRIILENPPHAVDFALQEGKGNNYKNVQRQTSGSGDLNFDLYIKLKNKHEAEPDFSGSFVQGTTGSRFVYVGIGTFAGQESSAWSRRLKIPLTGITGDMTRKLGEDSNLLLETRVPGTGKDGGPNCATVKPFSGWQLAEAGP